MWQIALRTLSFRKTAFIASFLALFAGAALVTACGTLLETGLRSAVAPQTLAAAPIVVAGDQDNASETVSEWARVNADAAAAARSVPGAATVVDHLSFPATVVSGGRPVGQGSLGHAWTSAPLTPYTLSSGTAPDAPGQLVLDAGLAARAGVKTGDTVEIAAHGTTGRFAVSGLAGPSGPTVDHPSVFFSASDAARLTPHPGQVDALAVFPAPGTEISDLAKRLTAAVGGKHAVVLTGDQRGLAEFPEVGTGAGRLQILAGAFAGWTLLATLFGVASMIALSIQQRQREFALLRAIGTTPRQVRQMVVAETLVLSVLAAALAAIPGGYLGKLLFDQFTTHGAASPLLGFERGWIPAVIGAIATMAAALGAAALASKRAARTKPVNALSEVTIEGRWLSRPRLVFALVFLGMGLSLATFTIAVMRGPFTVSVAGPASIFFAIGLALLAPGITKLMLKVLGAPIRRTGVMGDIAVLNARARTQRLAAAVTPVILLTGIATGVLYLQATEDSANQRLYSDNLNADVVVGSSVGGFAPGVVDRVRTVPGVAAASEFVTATGQLEQPRDTSQVGGWKLQGVNAGNATATASADPVEGDLAGLTGDTAAIPVKTARQHGVHVGDTIKLTLGDNSSLSPKVVALIAATDDSARILLPADVLAPHTTPGLPTRILVRAAPGTDVGGLTAGIMRDGQSVPGLWAADRGALIAGQSSVQQMLRAGNYAVVILVIGYAALSVVNTMVAATGHRRREFGLQRLAGSTRRQVLRMMSVEGLMAAIIGIVLGSVASVITLVPFSLVKNGGPIPSGPLWMYFAVLGFVGAVTLVSTLATTWRSTRTRPIEAATAAGAE
ncbi:ABC transporter permease [Amycolatopsis samaneae]|uniref:ABC transporter permease n=1 Tax=Amycolatopsis samaneae TaxID=664691 RepID=A0ABW5GDH6_9PSEU